MDPAMDDLLKKVKHLEETNEQMRTIINFSSDGLYVVDHRGITLEINKAYEEMTGISRDEVVGKNIRDLVFVEYFDRSAAYMALKSKKTTTIMQKIKKRKYFVATATPVFDSDNSESREVKMVVTSVRDLTYLNHLQNQIREAEQNKESQTEHASTHHENSPLVFNSSEMKSLVEQAKRIAAFPTPVLITGPSGTGKEVLANFVHQYSPQKDQPFVKVNCAAIPPELFESELFGFSGGSFTGARKEGKPGLFEQADKGTILLDEIGELPLPMQVKLLRVLQDQAVTRIGEVKPKRLSFRLICSTNQDLRELVYNKKFREDLWYRINVVHLPIQPLSKRTADIPPLIDYYLQKFCSKYYLDKHISPDTLAILTHYPWPGNIRELKNIIEFLVVSTPSDSISPRDLPDHMKDNGRFEFLSLDENREGDGSIMSEQLNLKETMALFESQKILSALHSSKSIRSAAKLLGIDHANLIRRMKRLGITYQPKDS
ncbi:PAS domain S-box protein [Bacillus aerolatus]|uniref:HTH-type transcriptional regulatory protein TyrR n=1 Tax=Bacillus aerolatus TaxID=2653354 RepID=A0A6I1FSF0_9BACI|nr:sigma 54-interacting transcriptional regulator [Bacillus aerolatus]KAB7707560.1 PAS domain S-box protein [Bacillus aerolatus]